MASSSLRRQGRLTAEKFAQERYQVLPSDCDRLTSKHANNTCVMFETKTCTSLDFAAGILAASVMQYMRS